MVLWVKQDLLHSGLCGVNSTIRKPTLKKHVTPLSDGEVVRDAKTGSLIRVVTPSETITVTPNSRKVVAEIVKRRSEALRRLADR